MEVFVWHRQVRMCVVVAKYPQRFFLKNSLFTFVKLIGIIYFCSVKLRPYTFVYKYINLYI